MRFIKLGIISIVFFSVLITGISLLLPSSINISRAIDINAPADKVHTNINNLHNWKNWYSGYDSSASFSGSNAVGKGASITMRKTFVAIESSKPDQISTTWKTGKSDPLHSEFNFITQGNSSHFTLQWQFVHRVKWYPWQKFASILSDKAIGGMMEKSLDNLKNLAEAPTPE